tara:strand:- start:4295 stop:5215 length:921 start_codon:yes stop_codon:yes gene_type:complete
LIKNKENILIAGGTGFIGSNLCKSLSKTKFNVFSCSTKKPNKYNKLFGVKYIKCDLSKKKQIENKLNRNFDYIVNLSGYINHSNAKKVKLTHYEACKNLANFFKKKKIKKFIQFGSSVEYGFSKSPQSERYILPSKDLKSYYGKAKNNSTRYLLKLNKNEKFPVIIFRLYLAYGPGQNLKRLIPFIIKKSLKNEKFPCSDGNQVRDLIFVGDLIKLIKLSLKKDVCGVYNLGSGRPIKIKSIIKKIIRIIGSGKPDFGKIKLRNDEPLILFPSIKKTKKHFNWKPKVNIDQGLKKTINFYKNEIFV